MELGHYDDECYLRPATADRAHAIDGLEWVREVNWGEGQQNISGAFSTIKLEVIGWVVNLIAEADHEAGKDAWKVTGVKSPFHVLRTGQWLQPVERVVFNWERIDFDPMVENTMPWTTKATDYADPGECYQPSSNQCSQIIRTYINGLDPATDLDPSALVPKGPAWEEAHEGSYDR